MVSFNPVLPSACRRIVPVTAAKERASHEAYSFRSRSAASLECDNPGGDMPTGARLAEQVETLLQAELNAGPKGEGVMGIE